MMLDPGRIVARNANGNSMGRHGAYARL
jgi:hypothetical protein